MKTLARLVTACCAVLLFVNTASSQAPSRPFLTGKWQGVLTAVGAHPDGSTLVVPPFDPQRGAVGFRLNIRATNLAMYFQNGADWVGVGEDPAVQDLRTNEQGRSAVVITAFPQPNGARESIMLNIVRWNEDTIAVYMSRVTGPDPNGSAGPPPPVNLMGILNRAEF